MILQRSSGRSTNVAVPHRFLDEYAPSVFKHPGGAGDELSILRGLMTKDGNCAVAASAAGIPGPPPLLSSAAARAPEEGLRCAFNQLLLRRHRRAPRCCSAGGVFQERKAGDERRNLRRCCRFRKVKPASLQRMFAAERLRSSRRSSLRGAVGPFSFLVRLHKNSGLDPPHVESPPTGCRFQSSSVVLSCVQGSSGRRTQAATVLAFRGGQPRHAGRRKLGVRVGRQDWTGHVAYRDVDPRACRFHYLVGRPSKSRTPTPS